MRMRLALLRQCWGTLHCHDAIITVARDLKHRLPRTYRMGAAFLSGASFSAISGMSSVGGGGANLFQSAFSTGVLFALLQGALYKVRLFVSFLC